MCLVCFSPSLSHFADDAFDAFAYCDSGKVAVRKEYRHGGKHAIDVVIPRSTIAAVSERLIAFHVVVLEVYADVEPFGDFCVVVKGGVESGVRVVAISEDA